MARKKRRLKNGMEVWEDAGGGTTSRGFGSGGGKNIPAVTKDKWVKGNRSTIIVRNTNVVRYPGPVTKVGGRIETERAIWKAVRSASSSDDAALRFLFARENWRDDEDDMPSYERGLRKSRVPAEWEDPPGLPTYGRFLQDECQSAADPEQCRRDLAQAQIILGASVMIVSVGSDGQESAVGIGTLTENGIVTHNHYGGTFGTNNMIVIRGAFGELVFQGDRTGYRLEGGEGENATGFIPLTAAQIAATGVPVSTAGPSEAMHGLVYDRLAYAFNPAGYLNQGCLGHDCLQVAYVGSPGENVFGGIEGSFQVGLFGGRPTLSVNNDGFLPYTGGNYNLMDSSYSDPSSQRVPGMFYADEYDFPLSPGDSGAGYFLGDTLIGTYYGAARLPRWGALFGVQLSDETTQYPAARVIVPIPDDFLAQ